ncbi:gustatory and pheromone receptor 39a-like [Haematobia irritans]|uniref:gustatory and pheromone receptor 39a-like n=1 Tax=Haematobia irritans TaxID=7368 RepID=UPI003F50C1A1
MSSYPELYLHIKTLNYLGLLTCYCQQDNNKKLSIIFNRTHEKRAKIVFFLIQLLYISILVNCCLQPQNFQFSEYTGTGNHHTILLFGSSCLFISCTYGYFHLNRSKNISCMQKLLKYHNEKCNRENSSRKQFYAYAIISITTFFNSVASYYQFLSHWTVNLSYLIVESSIEMIFGIIISIYMSIVNIFIIDIRETNVHLEFLAMDTTFETREKFRLVIENRYQLLRLCHEILNQCYGFIVLLIFSYILLSAPSGPYLIISLFMNNFEESIWYIVIFVVVIAIWSLPWTIIYVMIFKCNVLINEIIHKIN